MTVTNVPEMSITEISTTLIKATTRTIKTTNLSRAASTRMRMAKPNAEAAVEYDEITVIETMIG